MTAREIDLSKFNPPKLTAAERLARHEAQLEALQDCEEDDLVQMTVWVESQISKCRRELAKENQS